MIVRGTDMMNTSQVNSNTKEEGDRRSMSSDGNPPSVHYDDFDKEGVYHGHDLEESDLQVPLPVLNATGRRDIGKEEQDAGIPTDSDNEVENKPEHLGWNSADDSGNPRNWSFMKKVFHTAIPALYGFVM